MTTATDLRRNIEPFAVWDDLGVPRVVRRGELVDVADPVYRGREHMFETIDEHAARVDEQKRTALPVEQATAAPGEHRDVVIPHPAPEAQGDPRPDPQPSPVEEPSPSEVPDPASEPVQPPDPNSPVQPDNPDEPVERRGMQPAVDGWPCPVDGCEFTSATSRGLNIHQRVHNS